MNTVNPGALDAPDATDITASIIVSHWLTVDDAAALVQLHPQTIRAAIAAGSLPASRVGRAVRIRRSAVDTWMDSLSTTAPAS